MPLHNRTIRWTLPFSLVALVLAYIDEIPKSDSTVAGRWYTAAQPELGKSLFLQRCAECLAPVRRAVGGLPKTSIGVAKASDLDRPSFIRRAQNLGLTLGEIFENLTISEKRRSPNQSLRHNLRVRVQENKTKIEHLIRLQARTKKTLALWQTLCNGEPEAHRICRLIDSANEALRPLGYRPTQGAHNV